MTPEYLNELADLAAPGQLWRLGFWEQTQLPPELRQRLDIGVALRRHAEHVRRVNALLGTGKSLVITPLSPCGTATMTIPAPDKHRMLAGRREVSNAQAQARAEAAGRSESPAAQG